MRKALIVGMGLLLACEPTPSLSPAEESLWQACQQRLLDEIRTPQTAEFRDRLFVGVPDSVAAGDTITVVFTADYQNAFGALVTDQVACLARKVGDGWFVVAFGAF